MAFKNCFEQNVAMNMLEFYTQFAHFILYTLVTSLI